ncbi:hypothetical protein EV401DRAFT_1974783 [Pisolithus croceorrhizus]|nr:hypothetical protein EV401DRAFT_1974783 [Pisolithus croceorrhizus]
MSIVENVARQNRERDIASALATLNGHASSSSGNLPGLEVPRAPSLQVKQTSSTALGVPARDRPGQQVPNGRPRSLDIERSESAPSTSRVNTASTAPPTKLRSTPSSEVKGTPTSSVVGSSGTNPSTSSQFARVPLRSALRNASRTPSPNPVAFTATAIPSQGQNKFVTEFNQVRERSLEQVLSATQSSSVPDLRDSMSISSYETGRESPMSSSPSPPSPTLLPTLSPAPLPHTSLAPPLLYDQDSRDQSGGASSTVSTETPPTARRKSVRMSLQPTFSPPPPSVAAYDQLDEDEDEAVNTWSDRSVEGWKTRTGSHAVAAAIPTDVWQDSSEEDEEYSRARRLLGRVTKGKGKV